jgi:hypothetical protein
MAQKTLTGLLSGFPEGITKIRKTRKSTVVVPQVIKLTEMVKYFTNGTTASYSKMSMRQKNVFKSFLSRIREGFKDKVIFREKKFIFDSEVTSEEWIKLTHSNIPGYGKGSRYFGEPALRDSINRILDYVTDTEESVIPIDQLNLICMGVNPAKLKTEEVNNYGIEEFQTFQVLFNKIGIKANIVETKPMRVKAILENRPRSYRRDWSAFSSTQLVLEYDNIDSVYKAKEELKDMKILGGFFTRRISVNSKRDEEGNLIHPVELTAEIMRKVEERTDLISGDKEAVRAVLIENEILTKTYRIIGKVKEKLEEKIQFLDKQTRDLEAQIIGMTGDGRV